MKFLYVLFLPIVFAGCSTATDPEEQHFYNRGWLFPHRDLDTDEDHYKPPQSSTMPRQVHPEEYKQDPIVDDDPRSTRPRPKRTEEN